MHEIRRCGRHESRQTAENCPKLKRWYEQAGFEDVQERMFKLPLNPWPKDTHLKALGAMSEENCLVGLSGFSMGPFSRILHWSKDQIEVSLPVIIWKDAD